MSIKFEKKSLAKWLDQAILTDVTYHRSRQILWESFTKMCKVRHGERLTISRQMFNSIKGVLTSRSEEMTDTKRLAFDTALEELANAVEEYDAAVADADDGDDDEQPLQVLIQPVEQKESKEAPKAAE